MLSYNMKDFKIVEGENKVLISAPHADLHRRPNLLKKYEVGEKYTQDIVQELCNLTQSNGIMLVQKVEYDPNYHKLIDNPYKKEVERIVKEKKIKRFIDIHGLRNIYDIDIAIYYKTRFSKSFRMAQELEKYIDNGQLSGINIQILRLLDNDQETLTEYVADKLRLPAIQVEIAKYLREDIELRKSLLANISDFINS